MRSAAGRIGSATTLTFDVRPPANTHTVTVQQIVNWTERAGPRTNRET